MMPFAIAAHMLAAVIWVGGMFFAYMALRPATGTLDPGTRLPLWVGALRRFFLWVWAAIVILLLSGYWMITGYFGGMGHVGTSVYIMQVLGWVMILLFLHVYFAPFRRLKQHTASGDHTAALRQLNQIRLFVGINLSLGLVVIAVAAGGAYF